MSESDERKMMARSCLRKEREMDFNFTPIGVLAMSDTVTFQYLDWTHPEMLKNWHKKYPGGFIVMAVKGTEHQVIQAMSRYYNFGHSGTDEFGQWITMYS